jgi:hypothetical protein
MTQQINKPKKQFVNPKPPQIRSLERLIVANKQKKKKYTVSESLIKKIGIQESNRLSFHNRSLHEEWKKEMLIKDKPQPQHYGNLLTIFACICVVLLSYAYYLT